MEKRRDNSGKSLFLLPVLMSGYMETLRLAVFYACGWEGAGLLIFISLFISFNRFLKAYKPSGVGNFITLGMAALTLVLSAFYHPGVRDIGLQASYALLTYLVYILILERKSAAEVFVLGALLSLTAAAAADQGILTFLLLNIAFAFGLQSQLQLFALETHARVRGAQQAGINGRFWNTAILAVLLGSLLMAALVAVPMLEAKGGAGGKLLSGQIEPQVFSLAGSGANSGFWRKMQRFDFKGKVPVSDSPVMLVKAPEPSYWRGESADYYTGSGWQNSMLIRAVGERDYQNPYAEVLPVRKMEQEYTFLPGKGSEVIYHAGSPAEVAVSASNLGTDDGGNFYNRRPVTGSTYKVVSYITDFTTERLKQAAGSYPPFIAEKYLQLPPIPDRVRTLAGELAADAPTPYEKARKIEAYLKANYPYETTVLPPPGKRDIVDYFLFDLKKGYCSYHSTAMAVMLRAAGVPSRWITGFTTGVFSEDRKAYVVSMKNAHAWVEAYIPGAGWVPFEPTSSFTIPNADTPAPVSEKLTKISAAEAEPAKLKVEPGNTEAEPVYLEVKRAFLQGLNYGKSAIFIAVVLLVLLGIKRMRSGNNDFESDRVAQIYQDFLKLIGQKGYDKSAGQTPLEFAVYLCGQEAFLGCSDQIMHITNAYLKQRFSPEKLTGEEAEELRGVLKELSAKLNLKSRD